MRLLIMRHAKSSWSSGASGDHDRPLNKRGRKDAPRVAAELVERGWSPQLVLSSDSQRTRETWALMESSFPAAEARFLPGLYLAGIQEIQEACSGLEPGIQTVLVLGHNPGWERAASQLSGEDIAMTTANVALLEHPEGAWYDALHDEGGWTLVRHLRPKEL